MEEINKTKIYRAVQFDGENFGEIVSFVRESKWAEDPDYLSFIIECNHATKENIMSIGRASLPGSCHPLSGGIILKPKTWIVANKKQPEMKFLSDSGYMAFLST